MILLGLYYLAQSKVYIPGANNYACISIRSNDVIRAYKTQPNYNSNVDYDDYYINNNYYSVSGTQNFSQYTTLPQCVNSSLVTDEFYYRLDFDKILVMFIILCIFCFWLPLKLFSRFCKRLWR